MAPVLLDLMCGAGGTSSGYAAAGFRVVGVDKKPQPRYPFEFYCHDALDGGWIKRLIRKLGVVVVHASPPCQAYSDLQKQNKRSYPDLIAPTRALLRETGLPYVIENVEGAPLIDPIMLCGTMFSGLRVIRHRLFETNWPLRVWSPHLKHPLCHTLDKRKAHYGKTDEWTDFVSVNGGGNCTVAAARDAMEIHWPMTKAEINEAIPPAYTEWIGRQLLGRL